MFELIVLNMSIQYFDTFRQIFMWMYKTTSIVEVLNTTVCNISMSKLILPSFNKTTTKFDQTCNWLINLPSNVFVKSATLIEGKKRNWWLKSLDRDVDKGFQQRIWVEVEWCSNRKTGVPWSARDHVYLLLLILYYIIFLTVIPYN